MTVVASGTTASDINEHGWVVGSRGSGAVLWRNGEIHFLDDLAPSGSEWHLTNATALNNNRQIIGTARLIADPSIQRGFLLSLAAVYGDVDGDGDVDVDDLIAIVLAWGPCPVPPAPCPGDVSPNGQVDVDDLIAVILNWG
jgi:hypothetical protein